MRKRIVIIGGMGPQASHKLHGNILASAAKQGAKHGDDYPHILHISVPVQDFISDTTQKDAAYKLLITATHGIITPDDIVVMACNTAHLLASELEQVLGLRLTSLIDTTVAEVQRRRMRRIGLLATPTTIRSSLYRNPLQALGVDVQTPSQKRLDELESHIRDVIAGKLSDNNRTFLQSCINDLLESGCDAVILGCTELSVMNDVISDARIIDPLVLGAETVIADCTRSRI